MQPFICGSQTDRWPWKEVCRATDRGCTHVDFGRFGESAHRMDVVVQDDDPDHDTQAERHRLLAAESAAVLPAAHEGHVRHEKAGRCEAAWRTPNATYGVSNMTLHTVAIVLKQSVVFSIGRFLCCNETKIKINQASLDKCWKVLPAVLWALPRTQTLSCHHLTSSTWVWRRRRTEISDWPVHC